ncbi:GntR family transcriptional regulator [Salinicola avicenniae]|uniref:GntR family transcriptional regulator n=1 Tax=Salinicola avicenniae TaxID=2916836 RepID=UPI002073C2FA|nr:GntR family transcriptional regulator [Salinicola sp. S1-1-8]
MTGDKTEGWRARVLKDHAGPRWKQIAEWLRDAIRDGEFSPGDFLPTESVINEVFGVSRTTSRNALNQLVSEGLVTRRPGSGTVVADLRVEQPLTRLSGFSEDMLQRGLTPSFRVLSCGFRQASEEVALALGIASHDRVFLSERILMANDRIIGHSRSWIRSDVMHQTAPPEADFLSRGSLYEWIADHLGIEIIGGVEYIEAKRSEETLAELLDIDAQAPVLVASRVARDRRELPIEYAVVTYRADRYRFRLDL